MALENVSWERKTHSRITAWFVRDGCNCSYKYSGTAWSPNVWLGWLRIITNYVMDKIGWIENHPNSCNVNLYEDGMDAVGWHCDDEELFQSHTKLQSSPYHWGQQEHSSSNIRETILSAKIVHIVFDHI